MSTYASSPPAPARTFATLPDSRFTLLGDVAGYEVRGSTLVLDCGGPRQAVTFLADDVARVRLAPTGDFRLAGHGAGPDETPFSYALDTDRTWEFGAVRVQETPDALTVETARMRLVVNRSPCRLRFETLDGRALLDDTAGAGWATEDGRTEVRCWKALDADARFFGLGDKTFELDRRGRRLTFWNADTYAYAPEQDPIYKSIPFALTLAPATPAGGGEPTWTGAGLFVDNTYRGLMDLGSEGGDDWTFGSVDGELRYYVFAGGEGADLKTPLRRYCDLTGHKPMPARWSLGYHQSRWNYHDDNYARWVAHEFRRREIPLDCIHLDIGHMDGYRVFTWDKEAYPDPVGLNDDLGALGVRSVVIVDPGVKVDPDYFAYQSGTAGEVFCENPDGTPFTDTVWPGDVHWPDFSKAHARTWWAEQHRRYLDSGVTGFWNDMNEPAILGGRDFPDEVRFAYTDRGTGATDHREGHNVYGLLMAKATYEGLRQIRPDERPFLLTRACFSGSQRYAAAWTGDNVSTWEHLVLSLRICQSLSASGLAYCGPDIGGFAGRPTPELFARWMQAGVLYPFMRTHYSHEETEEQEPWSFGEEVEDVCRRAITLRYELMPTLYSAFVACAETGEPPMKALFLEHPDDPTTHTGCDTQTYLGPALMAAPVVEEGATSRTVYFPDVDGGWTDFYTAAAIAGGATETVDAPLSVLPLYVRGGHVVALDPPMLHTDAFAPETLRLRTAPGTGTSRFYFDDGISYAYETGDLLRLRIDVSDAYDGLTVAVAREGRRPLPYRRFEWQLPAARFRSGATADGRRLDAAESAEAFELLDEGVFSDGPWLRVRTRTDVALLTVR
jgi:alpha-glucosidase